MNAKKNEYIGPNGQRNKRKNEKMNERESITHRIFQASTQKHRPLKMFYALYIYYQERKANQNKK